MLLRLQRYVLGEVLKILLLALGGVSGIILVLMCIRAIQDGLPASVLPTVLPFYVPFVLPFSVPSALLIATVMAFGRLTGDNEMLAIRSSGVSVRRVIWPVLVLGLVLAALTTQLNNNLLPWCRRQVRSRQDVLLKQLKVEDIVSAAQQIDLDPYQVFIGGVDPEDPSLWEHVLAVKYVNGDIAQVIISESGRCHFGDDHLTALLELYNGTILQRGETWNQVHFPGQVRYSIDLKKNPSIISSIGTMSFGELIAARQELDVEVGQLPMPARPRRLRREIGIKRAELLEANINTHKARAAIGEKLERVDAELKSTWATITSLWERIQVTQEELNTRRRLLTQSEREIAGVLDLRKQVAEGTDRARRMDRQIADLTEQRDRLRKAVDEITNTLRVDKAQLAEHHTRVSQLRVDSKTLRNEYDGKNRESEDRQAVMKRLEDEYFTVQAQEKLRDITMQIHYRLAQSVACFVFVLLGIPLGILAGRGGIVVPFGVSFGVVIFVYYPVYTVGRHLADSGMMDPAPAMWLPNIICGTLGLILVWWASRR